MKRYTVKGTGSCSARGLLISSSSVAALLEPTCSTNHNVVQSTTMDKTHLEENVPLDFQPLRLRAQWVWSAREFPDVRFCSIYIRL